MEVDLLLLLLLTGGIALGFVRGALRQLVVLGAWLVTFMLAAYLRAPVGQWLAGQARQYDALYVSMLAFGLVFIVLFTIGAVAIELGGKTVRLSDRPGVDDVLGGLLGFGVTLLVVGSLILILDTWYGLEQSPAAPQIRLLSDLHAATERSIIASALRDSLIPGIRALLGPFAPIGATLDIA